MVSPLRRPRVLSVMCFQGQLIPHSAGIAALSNSVLAVTSRVFLGFSALKRHALTIAFLSPPVRQADASLAGNLTAVAVGNTRMHSAVALLPASSWSKTRATSLKDELISLANLLRTLAASAAPLGREMTAGWYSSHCVPFWFWRIAW